MSFCRFQNVARSPNRLHGQGYLSCVTLVQQIIKTTISVKENGFENEYEEVHAGKNGIKDVETRSRHSSVDTDGRSSGGSKGRIEMDPKKERRRIMKNIFLISLAFMCNFTAYGGLSRLQSSLHIDEGMGTITQSVLYGTLMISCMFVPKLLINLIGHKWTITVSFSGYILWMAANGYAVWGTMITASILVGLCAAPLWTAQCSYFTIMGARYAKVNKEGEDATVSRFFGIFFMFFQISSITGSIISSTILAPQPANPNETLETPTDWTYCGADDCPWNNVMNQNLEETDSTTVLDNLIATFKHLRHKEQWILIPLTMYSGFEQTFYSAEFTKSYVSCSLGIWKVGLVTLPYGFINAAVSMTGGHISKYTGRIPIFIMGMCMDLCTQFTLLFWNPNPNEEYVLYILAGMWGFSDGIWQTQINTVYGVLFSKESEAAFSNYRMWESLGFIIAFAYSTFLCTSVKLYILTSMLIIGMIGYFIVEAMQRSKGTVDLDDSAVEMKKEKKEKASATISKTVLIDSVYL